MTQLIGASEPADELAELFWEVAGSDEHALRIVLDVARTATDQGVRNIATLIGKATPRLAFTNAAFAKELIRHFTGQQRGRIVDALAHQAWRFGHDVLEGDGVSLTAKRDKHFAENMAVFPDDPDLEDLAKALRRIR